ncbi:hypothetical protein [Aromatoleum sp.]|uniref:hypothetical protein n=1 Tax=Aromatoleum sp. TaxID=2307007 RepID=UPI002FC837A6
MKRSLHPIVVLLLMFTGIGSGCAEEGSAGPRAAARDHYGYIDGAFLSGSGFSSGWEPYAGQETAGRNDAATNELANPPRAESGDHFSHTEYMFMTGAAFYSGPENYPISW